MRYILYGIRILVNYQRNMRIKDIKFNIFDLNFILAIAGFPIVTSLLPFVPSVPYRGFALLVTLICLFKTGFHFPSGSRIFNAFLLIFTLVHFRVLLELFMESGLSGGYLYARNFCFLFTFGVTFLPTLSVMASFDRMNWKTVLWVLCILLFLVIVSGIRGMNDMLPGELDSQRVSLNERQSTLAFGDNSCYLVILATSLLVSFQTVTSITIKRIIYLFLSLCIIAGFYGVSKAGSRGPFLSMVWGLIAIFFTMKVRGKGFSILALFVIVVIFGLNISSFEKFAPVLFERLTLTVQDGDLSGREILFQQALKTISENPILGGNPICLENGAFSTCHNGYLDVGLSLGVIGFVAYIILNFSLFIRTIKGDHYSYNPLYYFSVTFFFASTMRAMSGAGPIHNSTYAIAIGLACTILTYNSKQSCILNNND